MALSGILKTTDYEGRYLKLTWYTIQKIGTNTSTIFWNLEGAGEAQAGWYKAGPITVKLNGEVVYQTLDRITLYNGTWVAGGNYDVKHDNSGEAKLTAWVSGAIYVTVANVGGSASWDLNTIPRKASILTAPDFTDKDNPIITYSNPLGTNLASLQACISFDGSEADIAYRDINQIGTLSYTFNLTEEERNILKASVTSGTNRKVRFYVRTITYDGNTEWSWVERTFTLTVAAPTVKLTALEDINDTTIGLTGSKYRLIPGFSKVGYRFTATAADGATIAKTEVSAPDYQATNTTSGSYVCDKYLHSGTYTFTAKATDNRGNTSTDTDSLKVIQYESPSVEIDKGDVAITETSLRYRVILWRGYEGWLDGTSDGSGGGVYNTVKLYHRYEQNGVDSGWIEAPAGIVGSNDYYITVNGIDYTSSIKFQVKVEDRLTSDLSYEESARHLPVFDWSEKDFKINVPLKLNQHYGLSMPWGEEDLRVLGFYNRDEDIGEEYYFNTLEIGAQHEEVNTTFYGDTLTSPYGDLTIIANENVVIESEGEGVIELGPYTPVYINGSHLADFVVEYGTSDIFNYRKWNSGRCECWGSKNYGNMAVSTSWGSGYESTTFTQAIPSGLFVVAPDVVNIKIVRGGGGAWVLQGTATNASATSTGSFSLYRPVSGNLSQVYLSFYCMGRWK